MATVKVLVVAGGGGGGSWVGGGGGAGGVIEDNAFTVTPGPKTVTIGAGGAGQTSVGQGGDGSNSVFDSLTSIGGGGGGGITGSESGRSGGSGGGASYIGSGGTPTSGQGSAGGGSSAGMGCGGGGKGAAGSAGGVSLGGNGGNGHTSSISGSSQTYAGGGGGAPDSNQADSVGGTGGGGAGRAGVDGHANAVAGTPNTGGGGGGARNADTGGGDGGNGGSGIVIIRYVTADFGECTGGTITTDGADTIHTFTSSGTFTVVAGPITAALTGLGATSGHGSFGTGHDALLVGSISTPALGSFALVHFQSLTGLEATAHAGILTPVLLVVVDLVGESVTIAQGSVTETHGGTVGLIGSLLTGTSGALGHTASKALAGSQLSIVQGAIQAFVIAGPIGFEIVVEYYGIIPGVGEQPSVEAWIDITDDVLLSQELSIEYGVAGNSPMDSIASSGECSFGLRNDDENSGRKLGYYSPLHEDVRPGWAHDCPVRVIFFNESDGTQTPSSFSVDHVDGEVTVQLVQHGFRIDNWVNVLSSTASDVRVTGYHRIIDVVDTDEFIYEITPGSPVTISSGTVRRMYIKHYGKAQVIDPTSGRWSDRDVAVTSYDIIRDLAETEIREIDIQVNKKEDELVQAVFDAMDPTNQPVRVKLDAGSDTFPYAFYNIGDGTKALGLVADAAQSAFALFVAYGDGTVVLKNRSFRSTGDSQFSILNTQHGFIGPSSMDPVYDLIRISGDLLTIDPSPTSIIWASDGSVISVGPGEVIELFVTYRHPDDAKELVGALDVVDPLVGGTHYAGNSLPDGSGSNLTADLDITLDPFATTAKITIENTGASTVYLVNGSGDPFLHLLGRVITVSAEQGYESSSAPRKRPLSIKLAYASNGAVMQAAADYFHAQRQSLRFQPQEVTLITANDAEFMRQAFEREPGDVITVSEEVTGFRLVNAIIQRIRLTRDTDNILTCTWTLAPSHPFSLSFWEWGIVGKSEWGETTVYGF